ncbi:hypothetical protein J7443_07235 [Tropicibacter sp. R15_0]|uniref:hypothetical protein n=1 Tax=Tropicibacter sp. R15_0 TaxID=2821101 RepID=UPI001AD9803F|nr:hypothetical protein [Tropicibacter sp. R15_0]MBO9465016.1 hypothetical protein [Tropicibacter sp. R15_0]
MVSSSKILTVSYGTFSCTAEGFEDPLAVMKDTTHFFRSVVGEDRFFGAEPPQFDPELASELMRQQISAPEGGKVQLDLPSGVAAASSGALAAALAAGPARAKPEESVLEEVLPDDATIEATAYEPAPSPDLSDEVALEDDAAENQGDDTYEMTDPDATAFAADDMDLSADLAGPAEDAPAPHSTGAASVAAKLARIRAVVSDNEAEDSTSEPAAPTAEAPAEESFDEDTLSALLGETLSEPAPEAPAEVDTTLDVAEEEDNLFTDTIASVMQAASDEVAEAVEDVPNVDDVLDAAFDEEDEDFDLMSALDQVDQAEAAETVTEELSDLSDEDAEISVDDALTTWDEDKREDSADLADTLTNLTDTAFDEEEDDGLFDDEPLEDTVAEAVADPEPAPAPEPAPRRVRARVVKVKRTAFEQAVQSGQLEEIEEPDVEEKPLSAPLSATSSLSDEDEDDLARELAAVKAELAGGMEGWDDEDAPEAQASEAEPVAQDEDDWGWDDEEDEDLAEVADDMSEPLRLEDPVSTPEPEIDLSAAIDGARKAVKLASPARAMLTEQSVEDFDESRILDQTNTELEEPEGNRRRSAIAHLRAAVAATKADRLLGRKPTEAEETEPYREDLASVVRPRRPQSGGARTERPSAEPVQAAPLKLVAEQRVVQDDVAAAPAEAPAPAPVTPVRPRRVARSNTPSPRAARPHEESAPAPMAQPSGDGDFAAYAESVGASELPDLLEAAAAYMSYVEGMEQFSRPQLMTTVRQAEMGESSREDRLRSFGQLLRDGKIEKTSGGRFTASERISFKPSRAAG